jgi:hypothetical protein
MNRREFAGVVVGGVSLPFAGCLGGNGGSGPGADTDPEELVPNTPDGWEKADQGELLSSGAAVDGLYANYVDPSGAEYRIEVIKFGSGGDASDYSYATAADIGWSHEASVGRFFLACRLDTETEENGCLELLTGSSAVEEADVTELG